MPNNQQYSSMLQAAFTRLADRDPRQISRLADVRFEENRFVFQSLGQRVSVDYPSFDVQPQLEQWQTLTILHYLALADGAALQNQLITFSQHPEGLIRGGGFDRDAERIIQKQLGLLPPQALQARCLALGAQLRPSNADLFAEFHYLPRYPLVLKLWYADDELPASGRLFLDASAGHYLSIEDAVTVGEILLRRLLEAPG